MGPKHGVARGVAVFSSPDSRGSDIAPGPLANSERLRQWSLAHDVILTDDVASLEILDAYIDEWNADPSHFGLVDLGNDVGIYLGNVILGNVVGSRWHVWPNGHPVIALKTGRELDVTSLAHERLNRSGTSLPSLYAKALSD
jgi:Family of unknown function (DUF6278)